MDAYSAIRCLGMRGGGSGGLIMLSIQKPQGHDSPGSLVNAYRRAGEELMPAASDKEENRKGLILNL